MQCQSYFPSYNSHYDLNMDNNGGVTKPIYNDNRVFQSGYYKSHTSSLPVGEFFRQTIVMQEVTFRDQVRELHRVYTRQKELMGQSSIVQESKCKKIGGKLLDLELPAEEYIDVEECGFSEDGKSSNPPNSIDLSSNAPTSSSPIWKRDSQNPSSFPQKTNLVDLNEPLIASSDYEDGIIEGFDSHLGGSNRFDLNSAFFEEEEDVLKYDNKNSLCQKNLILSMNDDGLPQKSSIVDETTLKVDSEAPTSPEVEERIPPRGDSDCSDDDPLEELVKIAANAIVSISSSSSKYQPSPKNCEIFDTVTLEWFAGLVLNSVSIDLKTHSLDEFEAMTLNLTETKEKHFENFSSYSMPLSREMKTGRRTTTRRPKRKDFQREVLPSIASLSRYEVTEDINLIEVLMEAAGTPWLLSKARRVSRIGTKPRDKPMSKNQLKGWGKANRRPRGQRSPASPTSVLSKWLAYSI